MNNENVEPAPETQETPETVGNVETVEIVGIKKSKRGRPKKSYKGEIWEISIANGAIDMVHGNFEVIKEIYIREKDLSLNMGGGLMHVFNGGQGRYLDNISCKRVGEIGIGGNLVKRLNDYLEVYTELRGMVNALINPPNLK